MRYLLVLVLLLSMPVFGQDKKVSQLPADTVLTTNDLFYIIDQGTTSKKMAASVVLNAAADTVDVLRNEVDTAKANIRAAIGGGGILERVGGTISFVNDADSFAFGYGTTGIYQFLFNGPTKFTDKTHIADTLRITNLYGTSNGLIYTSGDNLMFDDDNTSPVSLSTLIEGGGIFSKVSTTNYMTPASDNINFGGTTATTHKVKVTGTFNVTEASYLGAPNYDTYVQGVLRLSDRISWSDYGGRIVDADNYGISFKNLDNSVSNELYLDFFYPDRVEIRHGHSLSGITIFDDNGTYGDGIMFKVNDLWYLFDGTYFRNETDTLGFGGGGGGDISDGGTANDTIWLGYESTSNKTRWTGGSHTKGLYFDSTSTAGYGLTNDLASIYDFMADTAGGELLWSIYDPDGTEHKTRSIDTLSPGKQIQTLMDAIEKNYRYNLEQQREIDFLKIVICALIGIIGLLILYNIFKR